MTNSLDPDQDRHFVDPNCVRKSYQQMKKVAASMQRGKFTVETGKNSSIKLLIFSFLVLNCLIKIVLLSTQNIMFRLKNKKTSFYNFNCRPVLPLLSR